MKKFGKIKWSLLGLILIPIVLIIGVTYSYFSFFVDSSKGELTNINTGTMEVVFEDGDNGIKEALQIGSSVHKRFTLRNTGTLDAVVSMNWAEF